MHVAYIGLGSNQGDPLENLRQALKQIDGSRSIKVQEVSSLYLTEPVGYEDQPWFYNCVARMETGLSPEAFLTALQEIEHGLGRVRTIRWGPRTVDLDILLYDDLQLETDNLVIPHPRMKERAFVMVPLAEIAGDLALPGGETVQAIRERLGDEKKYSCIPQRIW